MDRQAFIDKVDMLVEKKAEERKLKYQHKLEVRMKKQEQMKRKFEVILEKAIDGAIENDQTYYIYEFKEGEMNDWGNFSITEFLKENNLSHKVSVKYQHRLTKSWEGLVFNFK